MPRKLWYVPIEPIAGRWTEQWARPVTGWFESLLRRFKIPYERICPATSPSKAIGAGKVLNPLTRTYWGMNQTQEIVRAIIDYQITDDDVIWFDDFWHPGLEMIPYAAHQRGIKPGLMAFCHAQSVDQYDFMHEMRSWARPVESGFARIYDSIFVNNPMLKELCEVGWGVDNVYAFGHVFNSLQVWNDCPIRPLTQRENHVLFTSRFDREKDPHLFMDVVELMTTSNWRANCTFEVCTGFDNLQSDDALALRRARKLQADGKLTISENLSKEEYYRKLATAAVQLSTSKQDWVSFCLLEAVTLGCIPLYPNERSFPWALQKTRGQFLYYEREPEHIATRLEHLLSTKDFNDQAHADRHTRIVEDHNNTVKNILQHMGFRTNDQRSRTD